MSGIKVVKNIRTSLIEQKRKHDRQLVLDRLRGKSDICQSYMSTTIVRSLS